MKNNNFNENTLFPVNLQEGKLYECFSYDLNNHTIKDKNQLKELREFLSASINEGWIFKVEKKDEVGLYFFPFKTSTDMVCIPYDLNVEFLEYK